MPLKTIKLHINDAPFQFIRSLTLWLNLRKAGGPDSINNWLLQEYADFLTCLVHDILDSSFVEQKLLWSWKDADISQLLKVKPVTIITKDIRAISITPGLSKLTGDFVVHKPIDSAVLEVIDPL